VSAPAARERWRDPAADPAERVADLMARMSLREKVAQLYGVWVGLDTSRGEIAPHQHDHAAAPDWDAIVGHGIGQLTRPFGTAPVDPEIGARALARSQRQIIAAGRHGIPAVVHEECLTGLHAWRAAIYPSPLCWGASFDPALVERMGAQIGAAMRSLGVHQGLAPVLDVARDLRWGRVEETIGEDPWLVGTLGSAYVRGLESAGVVSTLKHFAGYSASRGGRNLAPVSIGPRELADVLVPPFELALRAGARSVMNAYPDLDGLPVAADPALLTGVLRDELGFAGTVVADYFAVTFLHSLHGVAADAGEAAGLALAAGIDVELPTVAAYGEPLVAAVEAGAVDEALVDRALARVLAQKCELGLLDAGWSPEPSASVDLDPPEARELAAELARRSIVLLANDGTLPLAPGRRVAVVGPRADDPHALLGCYAFPVHVGVHHPDVPDGVALPTVLEALRGDHDVVYAPGGDVTSASDAEIASAVAAARGADVCVAVLGDRSGLFGRGTSGEGCDAVDLRLPGRQEELLEALLATGTPVVLVLLVGRPYELSRVVDRLAAALCAFFPGEAGAAALADVLAGRANPGGKLPVHFPAAGEAQPATYLAPVLGEQAPLFAFGHGLSYAAAEWVEVGGGGEWPTDGVTRVAVTLRNDADRPTSEVVQVYLHDPVAEVVRPARQLIAAARVDLAPGEARTTTFTLHADLTSYTGRAGRCVDPGAVELLVGASSVDIRATLVCEMTGPRRAVGPDRALAATMA
jgi:beta-glucosidase